MKPRIVFAPIDAKGDDLTVAFIDQHKLAVLGRFNGRLAMRLEREYLTRLYQLQEELRLNYLSQWNENDTYMVAKHKYELCFGLTDEEYQAQKQALIQLYPGPTADFYT